MAPDKAETKYHKFFNLKKISDALKIQPDKLYNNFDGKYDSLGQDKDKIAKLMMPYVIEFFKKLGYVIMFKKSKVNS